MLQIYTDFAVNEAAVPVIPGIKSQSEKFAGAIMSTTIEAMMQDTRALQSGTSHFLGQNFSKAFNIQFLDESNTLQYAWTTSWGLSTRFIGAIIMTHGDDQGLILPPRLAPLQVIIVPILKTDQDASAIMQTALKIKMELLDAGIRVKIDDRTEVTPGYKFNDWELRGVPLRIEIGPKDVQQGTIMTARRDKPGREGKENIPQGQIAEAVRLLLEDIQRSLLERATSFRNSHIVEPKDYGELVQAIQTGWGFAYWCESEACEQKLKEETKATTRCIPLDPPSGPGTCIICGKRAERKVYIAKSY
jgi:prolyl-tRNA synthetase